MIEEAPSWESFLESSSSWKEYVIFGLTLVNKECGRRRYNFENGIRNRIFKKIQQNFSYGSRILFPSDVSMICIENKTTHNGWREFQSHLVDDDFLIVGFMRHKAESTEHALRFNLATPS